MKAIDAFRGVPVVGTFGRRLWRGVRQWRSGVARMQDRWFRIESHVSKVESSDGGGYGYLATDYAAIRYLQQVARMTRNDVFFDIGCGMGRVVCMVARQRVKKCVGVEYAPSLTVIALRNARNMRGRKTPIEIHTADATKEDYTEGTVFFLYNPFGRLLMQRVLDRIHQSLVKAPRPIRIVYMYPTAESKFTTQEKLFAATPWLKLIHSAVRGKTVVSVWESNGR